MFRYQLLLAIYYVIIINKWTFLLCSKNCLDTFYVS